MKCKIMILLAIAALAFVPLQAQADIVLNTAGNFAVLAGSSVTNTGATVINGGDVGAVSSITGFPPGTITTPFTTHLGDAAVTQGLSDFNTAFNAAAALTPTQDLTGQNLGGLTLTPGVYYYKSSAQLTGTLTLDSQGDPNAQFVFQIGSSLTTDANSVVTNINGDTQPGCPVFWEIGSSAVLGSDTAFEGHILAGSSITLVHGATLLDGSALAGSSVAMDCNEITNCAVPEPATLSLLVMGGLALLRRRRTTDMG